MKKAYSFGRHLARRAARTPRKLLSFPPSWVRERETILPGFVSTASWSAFLCVVHVLKLSLREHFVSATLFPRSFSDTLVPMEQSSCRRITATSSLSG